MQTFNRNESNTRERFTKSFCLAYPDMIANADVDGNNHLEFNEFLNLIIKKASWNRSLFVFNV